MVILWLVLGHFLSSWKRIGLIEKKKCMFPEGLSRYYPELAPLKQGVARIVSDALTRQKDNPNFELAIQTCSITC